MLHENKTMNNKNICSKKIHVRYLYPKLQQILIIFMFLLGTNKLVWNSMKVSDFPRSIHREIKKTRYLN